MRRAAAFLVLLFTLLTTVFASATALQVDGGTIQVFTYPAEVELPPVKARLFPTATTEPTSAWDGSQLEFSSLGFFCTDGYPLFAEIVNRGAPMQEPSTWTLLRGEVVIAEGEIKPLASGAQARLEFAPGEEGIYRFMALQRADFPGEAALLSLEIAISPRNCPARAADTPTPTATATATTTPLPSLEPRLTDTPSPSETPAPTGTAEPTATLEPSPTNTPTLTPTDTPTPTLEPTVEIATDEAPTSTPTETPEPTAEASPGAEE